MPPDSGCTAASAADDRPLQVATTPATASPAAALLGVALLRALLARDRHRRMWPIASAGITGVLVAGFLTTNLRPSAVTASGEGLVPVPVVLYQYGWTLVGAAWAIGLVLILGATTVAACRRN